MKKNIFVFMAMIIATPAMAAPTMTCKKLNEASGQGYEVTITGSRAKLDFKGKKVADLYLNATRPSPGGDREAVANYRQNVVNGYGVDLISGELAGLTVAKVLRDGVAGFTEQATLNDCK